MYVLIKKLGKLYRKHRELYKTRVGYIFVVTLLQCHIAFSLLYCGFLYDMYWFFAQSFGL